MKRLNHPLLHLKVDDASSPYKSLNSDSALFRMNAGNKIKQMMMEEKWGLRLLLPFHSVIESLFVGRLKLSFSIYIPGVLIGLFWRSNLWFLTLSISINISSISTFSFISQQKIEKSQHVLVHGMKNRRLCITGNSTRFSTK